MKTLIIYFSRTGNTKKVAEEIQKKLNCELEEIKDAETNREGMLGYMRSGKEASLKKLPPIKPLEKNLADYDLIIIGTPVWAFTMSSPVRTFISENKDRIKTVALFCTHGGGPKNTLKNMAELIGKEAKDSFDLSQKAIQQNNYEKTVNDFIERIK